MSLSLACRALCLAGLAAALAAPEARGVPDGAALFQKDVQAHSAISKPLAGQEQRDIAKALAEAYQTYKLMARTAAASAQLPQVPIDMLPGNMTMDDIIKIATDVLVAFEDEEFFAAVKKTVGAVKESFLNFITLSKGQLDLLVNAMPNSTDEQLFLLMKGTSLQLGDALMEVAKVGLHNVQNTVDKMPAGKLKDMAVEGMKGADAELEQGGTDLKRMITDVYSHNDTRFCRDVTPIWQGCNKMDHEVQTNILPSFNKTSAQVAELRPMIEGFAPKVADKLMGLLDEAVAGAYAVLSEGAPVLHSSTEAFGEAYVKSTGCSFGSAGSRLRPGAAAALAALAAGLWAGAH